MKILIVTSQITYVPNNCQKFFDELMKNNSEHISGLVVLQNLSFDIIAKISWLYSIGCSNFATTLLKNYLMLFVQKREKLFNKQNLPIFKLKSMNDPVIVDWVRKNNIDLIINLRTRCIYKKEILTAPRFGCVNIHHGILPKYRGIFSDLYALHENRSAGITIHQMTEKIDDGDILFTKQISNKNDKNYMAYLSKTGIEEAKIITKLIQYIEEYGKMPNGTRSYARDYVITQTPTRNEIRDMQKGGMVL